VIKVPKVARVVPGAVAEALLQGRESRISGPQSSTFWRVLVIRNGLPPGNLKW